MFRIVSNKLFEYLFARALAFYVRGSGSIPGRDMSISGPLVEDGDDLGQVSGQMYIVWKSMKRRVFWNPTTLDGHCFRKKLQICETFLIEKKCVKIQQIFKKEKKLS